MSLRQRRPRREEGRHLAFLRRLPCAACAALGAPAAASSEAAHLRAGSIRHGKPPGAMAMKPDDRWALPLCPRHHREQHAQNELAFWRSVGVDPFLLALVLWGLTGDDHAAVNVITSLGSGGR